MRRTSNYSHTEQIQMQQKTAAQCQMTRRHFLSGIMIASGLFASSPALALMPKQNSRSLSFRHTHTGEEAQITYWRDGQYCEDGLSKINHLMRDHRTGEAVSMDKGLLDLLHDLDQSLGSSGTFEIISGYRSPKTNNMLRGQSSGVAKRSLHMRGMAIDVRYCGCKLKQLREAALDLKCGGVGYYPKSDFIHVDTGAVRQWRG